MRLKIFGNECWIKNVELPLDFHFMNDNRKWFYICKNKLTHRENGPAVTYFDGTEAWWLNGLKHREDGPAIIDSNGTEAWYLYGKCYRIDGPAVILSSGTKWWFLNGNFVNREIYKGIQNSSKEELLVYMIDSEYKNYLSLIEYRLSL